ncbi:hypothetical protein HOR67_gp43 [Ralstonia phage RS-PI-1]|uniref:Uncharacterized protein n=1 Tax=Ralstonia phage RS-PI-1 TaxID=1958965 RepID=A0A1S6L1E0_9CAUD|nr:hypothetical protein HOR67_gp43 [Ralstonia phage RS-PI-1]AQT27805.1 hypothetical protein [Ralstonia phage RS-PI-1]
MLVFRVEDAAGVGAYRSKCHRHPEDDARQPLPWEDRGLMAPWAGLCDAGIHKDYFFGFGSLTQARRWFHDGDWRASAHEAGLRVSVYKVDALACSPLDRDAMLAYRGSKQVVFRKASAQLVRSIPLNTL